MNFAAKEALAILGLAALSCGPLDNPSKNPTAIVDQANPGSQQPPLTEAEEKANMVKNLIEDQLKRYPIPYRNYNMDQKSWQVVITRPPVRIFVPAETGSIVTNFPDTSRFSVAMDHWIYGEPQEVDSNILIIQENKRTNQRDYWLGLLKGDNLQAVRVTSCCLPSEFKGTLIDETGVYTTVSGMISRSEASVAVSNNSTPTRVVDPLRTF